MESLTSCLYFGCLKDYVSLDADAPTMSQPLSLDLDAVTTDAQKL